MAISIVYLSVKGLVSLFIFIQYVNILLFHWVCFTSFFGYFIEQNICFYSFRSSHWKIFYKIAVLHQC